MLKGLDQYGGGKKMAVLAIRKPSAYVVKTSDKEKFMNGKADKTSVIAIKDASSKLRRKCVTVKKK